MEIEIPDRESVGTGKTERRVPRSIRFSDEEWGRIEALAEERGVTAAELVRFVALSAVEDGGDCPVGDLTPLIERMFRYTYIMATEMREEMIEAGRGEELEKLIETARRLQEDLVGKPVG